MNYKPKILYVSYDGILEPLGYSQVYKYLIKQSENFQIDLISFEKTNDDYALSNISEMKLDIDKYGINWICKKYYSGLGWISSIRNLTSIIINVLSMIIFKNYSVVHVRSYLPAIPLVFARPFVKTKFIFDIRGFWIDEKHDRLGWKKNSLKFVMLKFLEKRLFKLSDHIVTLTEESKKIIIDNFNIPESKITCIRTCVDLDEFQGNKNFSDDIINIGYLGSVDTAYDFNLFLDLIRFFEKNFKNRYKVTILTKQVDLAMKHISDLDFNFGHEIKFVSGSKLIKAISKFSFLAFFLIKNKSLRASMPTKIAEALAMGVPIICNSFNNDICKLLEEDSFGIILNNSNEIKSLTTANIHVMLSEDQEIRCKQAAKKHFNLEDAVIKYKKIYDS